MITIDDLQHKLASIEKIIPIKKYLSRIVEIDEISVAEGFWDNPKAAGILMKERENLSSLVGKLTTFQDSVDYVELFPENVPAGGIDDLYKELKEFEFKQLMSGKNDALPCIINIVSGSGGLESKNFVSMLARMYARFCSNKGFNVEIVDEQRSDDHSDLCIDNISLSVSGKYAYGHLKLESGVHRLIRHSPFNAGNAVQTSFAACSITPDIEDEIEIKIEDKDIELSFQSGAGGSGGQHQNATASAVRLKHIPSGINILVRNERDQHANRKIAFKLLRAKLYELEEKKRQEEADKKVANTSAASFGHQVRSYSFTSNIVKDHRSGFETKQIEAVLDGDLEEIIMSVLKAAQCPTN
jgi:peptide chain release factor 2